MPGDTNGPKDVFRKEFTAPYRLYFAEGYTGSGFREYPCLDNPYGDPVDVTVAYLYHPYRGGTTKEEACNLPGNARRTVNVITFRARTGRTAGEGNRLFSLQEYLPGRAGRLEAALSRA